MFEWASRAITNAAHTASQNPIVGIGVINRRTYGPSFVTLLLCLARLFALQRVFEHTLRAVASAAHTESQNPTVGTGVLNRWTFGLSLVTPPLCLAPLLL